MVEARTALRSFRSDLHGEPSSPYLQLGPLRDLGGRPRENITFRLSYDEGKTWPIAKVLEPQRGGYTDLAFGPDGTLYCIYEHGFIKGNNLNTRYLTVARF